MVTVKPMPSAKVLIAKDLLQPALMRVQIVSIRFRIRCPDTPNVVESCARIVDRLGKIGVRRGGDIRMPEKRKQILYMGELRKFVGQQLIEQYHVGFELFRLRPPLSRSRLRQTHRADTIGRWKLMLDGIIPPQFALPSRR